jgi:signal transduction histidine kinase
MPATASRFTTGARAPLTRLERRVMRERPARRRRWLPRPTVRLRLTMLYGSLFLIAGAGLLAITYELVAHNTDSSRNAVFALRAKGFEVGPARAKGVSVPSLGPGTTVFARPDALYLTQTQVAAVKKTQAALPPGLPAAVRPYARSFLSQGQVAVNHVRTATLGSLLTESGIALGIMAVLSIGLGWLMAGRALAPVRTMNARVRRMSADNLHERLALTGHDDELKELGDTFDGLLERLESAFESQRAFVANASHELRTPLTVERALIEVALADPDANVESMRETLGRVLVAGEQQERTIEALLTLARSQRGLQVRELVDLRTAAVDAADGVETGDVRLECRFEHADTVGDPALVERLVSNLLRNAVQHNVTKGWARAWTGIRDGRPTLTVSNSGPPVAQDEAATLLEPFRRLDGARTRHDGGIGLGLSIVGAIATAHGAELTVNPRGSGGLQVVVGFPTA